MTFLFMKEVNGSPIFRGWPSVLLAFFQSQIDCPGLAHGSLACGGNSWGGFRLIGLAQFSADSVSNIGLIVKHQIDCPRFTHGSLAYGGNKLVGPLYWVGPALC